VYAALPAADIRDTFLRHIQASPSQREAYMLDRETHGRMARKLTGMIRQAAQTMVA
jgi:GTP1/Obg family GTP-binding protein